MAIFDNSRNILIDKRLYELYSDDNSIIMHLNSTLFPFMLEIQSRSYGGGGGPIDATVYEICDILVVDISDTKNLFPRQINSIFEELGLPKPEDDYSNINPDDVSLDKVLPDRRALDKIIFEAIGLTEDEQLQVYRAVVDLVKSRLTKARTY